MPHHTRGNRGWHMLPTVVAHLESEPGAVGNPFTWVQYLKSTQPSLPWADHPCWALSLDSGAPRSPDCSSLCTLISSLEFCEDNVSS